MKNLNAPRWGGERMKPAGSGSFLTKVKTVANPADPNQDVKVSSDLLSLHIGTYKPTIKGNIYYTVKDKMNATKNHSLSFLGMVTIYRYSVTGDVDVQIDGQFDTKTDLDKLASVEGKRDLSIQIMHRVTHKLDDIFGYLGYPPTDDGDASSDSNSAR